MSHAPTPSGTPRHSPQARAQGIACAIASAALFACNTNLARLSFASGADAATMNAVRFVVTVLLLQLLSALRRSPPPLNPRQRFAALALGVLFFLTSFGYMGAIQFIPVSIAVLLLYSYPILVALMASLSEGERLGSSRIAALVLAFVGVALALGVTAADWPDGRGVALAVLAAAAMSVFVIGSSRLLRLADRGEVNRLLMTAAAFLFLLMLLAGGTARWPASGPGWLAFGGAVITFALAQLALLAAIGRAGPVLAATLMNLEPLLTIVLAVLLVGERLTGLQLAGAALVLSAIYLTGRRPARSALRPPGTPAKARPSPHIL